MQNTFKMNGHAQKTEKNILKLFTRRKIENMLKIKNIKQHFVHQNITEI